MSQGTRKGFPVPAALKNCSKKRTSGGGGSGKHHHSGQGEEEAPAR